MFPRYKPAPPEAETIPLHVYTHAKPGGRSRYIEGLDLPSVDVLSCPACKTEQNIPDHGEHGGCIACDLEWVAFGNALNIWKVKQTPTFKIIKGARP
jgi:hypothetical protein